MSYDIDQDFWEKKQGDGSANRFTGGKAKFDPDPPTKDMGLSKGWKDKGKDKGKGKGKGEAVGKILKGASKAVDQFTQSQKVDYSGINKSSRGNVGETDLTQPGYSDYFAKDNKGPV